jgi:acetolactate synthase-1/2/3 large subunit
MTMKLSDYVFRFVADLGVRHVFLMSGGGAMHLNDSAGHTSGLEYVAVLHEQAAAIAAEAYARVNGNLGVALVTTGPGGTNALTGVAGGWLESTPMLVLSGQVKRADLMGDLGVRQLGLQELDVVSMAKPVTKYAVMVTDPQSIRYHLEKAVHLARTGRKGPVWLDLPLDVQAAKIEPESLPRFDPASEPAPATTEALREQVAQTLALLEKSERPVLLLGNGVRFAGAAELAAQAIERLGVPVLRTWMAADLLPHAHRLNYGFPGIVAPRYSNFIVQNADFLLSVGARLDFAVTGYDQTQFARAAAKVVVDVDAAELRKLKMRVDVPVCADAGAFLAELLRQLGARRERPEWLARCDAWRERYPLVDDEMRRPGPYVNSFHFVEVLTDLCRADDLLVPGSAGCAIDTFWMALRNKPGQRAFSTGGLGAMGFGVPAAIGGCVASGRRTITCDGDGGFQLNIQELQTVSRLRLPIKYFLLCNGAYASIRGSQRAHFKRLTGADPQSGVTLPDHVAVARAYGLHAARIEGGTDLRAAVQAVLDEPGPSVCEIMMDPEQSTGPRTSSYVRPDGSMISRPLEDLFPFLDRAEFKANMIVPPLPE